MAWGQVSNYVSTAPDVNVFSVLRAELTSSSTLYLYLEIICPMFVNLRRRSKNVW